MDQLQKFHKIAYESAKDRLDMTEAAFLASVEDWDAIPLNHKGKTIGVLLTKGQEIHACILPEGYSRWFYLAKPHLEKLLDNGEVYTAVFSGNEIGETFITRIGFKFMQNFNGVDYYMLNKAGYKYGH